MNTAIIDRGRAPELQFILKVASRCNLNCSYCYVYNKGDTSWRQRPAIMPPEIFSAALRRIRDHCERSGQESVRITFHGGEPCLVGPDLFGQWCQDAYDALHDMCQLDLSLQTNGTLIDHEWVDVFRRYSVSVGVSLDGPAEINDLARVDHVGHGSYDKAVNGLSLLRDNDISFQVLCVVQLGANSRRIHRHLLALGAKRINYLLPDFTHDTIAPIHRMFGPTPCADYLLPILEDWWSAGSLDIRIGFFWNMARLILGGRTQIDVFGNACYQYVFIETDGDIEGLDVLRIGGPGLSSTRLHVLQNDFTTIADSSPLHRKIMFEGMPLPTTCRSCQERSTCGGGYLPHRYSAQRGFDNPTVWCQDMLRLFGRMREMLGVTVEETGHRHTILEETLEHGPRAV